MFTPHQRPPDDPSAPALWFCVWRGQVLVVEDDEGRVTVPTGHESPIRASSQHVLGSLLEKHAWGVDAGADDTPDTPAGHRWMPLRGLFGQLDDLSWTVAGRAEQILAWDRTHRYCGQCGAETQLKDDERARICPRCRLMQFPRLSPATITLVERGDEILLAHGRQFPGRFYSTLAGFVEPGEDLETCVAREILEETNIVVTDIRYFKSQPWPFPNSLMIGFNARYESGDIKIQESEIVDAGWFTADDLPPHPQGGMSIAGWLIEDWLKRIGRI